MSDFFSSCIGFAGRLDRRSYIRRTLVLWAIAIAYGLLLSRLHVIMSERGLLMPLMISQGVFIVIFSILFIMLMVRRLHDFGRSGWWIPGLIAVMFAMTTVSVPLGQLLNVVFQVGPFFIPGTKGDNKYGPDPLAGS